MEHPYRKYDSNIEPPWVLTGIVQACPKNVEQHAIGINKALQTRLRSSARRHYRIAISAPQQSVPALPSMSIVDKVRTNEWRMPSPFLHLKAVFERCLAVAVYKVSTILARFGCTALVGADKSVQKRMCDCGYIATVGRRGTFTFETNMHRLESLRRYFDEWQEQGYATRPGWYDEYIDKRINDLTNVDLLELLDTVEPLHLQDN